MAKLALILTGSLLALYLLNGFYTVGFGLGQHLLAILELGQFVKRLGHEGFSIVESMALRMRAHVRSSISRSGKSRTDVLSS